MSKFAYITLLTKPTYLAGVVILAHSLREQQSAYPLIVCYTPTLPNDCIQTLESEKKYGGMILRPIDPLQPPALTDTDLIAERFRDTWTKLRVFEPFKQSSQTAYDRICFLDADMMLRKNLDFVFDAKLPGNDWIAASHACVCNLDSDPWAPSSWRSENCAHTLQDKELSNKTEVPHSSVLLSENMTQDRKHTYTLLNSGLFLFCPSQTQWERILHRFSNISPEQLKSYKFPDQDFLIEFFQDRWISLPWSTNALKTMRYWHTNMWEDESVVNLHYIVDKPWAGPRPIRIWKDGRADFEETPTGSGSDSERLEWHWSKTGFKGRDGETHSWWWNVWDDWKEKRQDVGDEKIIKLVENHMYGGKASNSLDMQSIGTRVQAFATRNG